MCSRVTGSSRALLLFLRRTRNSGLSSGTFTTSPPWFASSVQTSSYGVHLSGFRARSFCTAHTGDGNGEHHGPVLPADGDIVQFIDLKNAISQMSFVELKALAAEAKASKGRDLIHIHSGKRSDSLPTFRLLQPTELETVVRKNRQFKKHLHFNKVSLDGTMTESGRIKEKQITLRVGILEHDLEVAIGKIRKWLQKDLFIRVAVEGPGGKKKEAIDLQNVLKEKCLADGNETKVSNLTFKTH